MSSSLPTPPSSHSPSPRPSRAHWDLQEILSTLPPPPASDHPFAPTLYLLHLLRLLKTTPREGWLRHDVPAPESIAEHMYRMAMISLFCAPEGIDKGRAVQLALVHDMAELLVGDITPLDQVPKPEKHRREVEAMEYLTSLLPSSTGSMVRGLWDEYEDGQTPEARFVKDVDKFELLLQMVEYERDVPGRDLGEFWHVAAGVKGPQMKEWVGLLEKERKDWWDTLDKKGKVE